MLPERREIQRLEPPEYGILLKIKSLQNSVCKKITGSSVSMLVVLQHVKV
jgi:hypothetical protein